MDDEDTQTQLCRLSCIDPLDEVRQAGVVIGGHPAQ
jgi:hypothetical protein